MGLQERTSALQVNFLICKMGLAMGKEGEQAVTEQSPGTRPVPSKFWVPPPSTSECHH